MNADEQRLRDIVKEQHPCPCWYDAASHDAECDSYMAGLTASADALRLANESASRLAYLVVELEEKNKSIIEERDRLLQLEQGLNEHLRTRLTSYSELERAARAVEKKHAQECAEDDCFMGDLIPKLRVALYAVPGEG